MSYMFMYVILLFTIVDCAYVHANHTCHDRNAFYYVLPHLHYAMFCSPQQRSQLDTSLASLSHHLINLFILNGWSLYCHIDSPHSHLINTFLVASLLRLLSNPPLGQASFILSCKSPFKTQKTNNYHSQS